MVGPDEVVGPVEEVAPRLLGAWLVRRRGDGTLVRGRIVEVEAYAGPEDAASHARYGPTGRARPMYGPPGHAYVYLIYGMHHCVNVVTGPEGTAAAVLVRALEPGEGVEGRTDGPGRLTRALGIDRGLDGMPLSEASGLWLEPGEGAVGTVVASPRIGIDYAGEPWRSRPWRFVLEGNRWVSGGRR